MSEWQPIETAPKDETDIVLGFAGQYRPPVIAGWFTGPDSWEEYDSCNTVKGKPTHWMPCPEPPEEGDARCPSGGRPPNESRSPADAAYIKLLERRIHNQRVRLRELEKFETLHRRSIWARIYLEWRRGHRSLYAIPRGTKP